MTENKTAKTPADDGQPVAWIHNFIEGGISIGKKPTDLNRHPDRWTALYKDQTPCKTCQALAMAVMNDQTYHEEVTPKREWVGLTDEEIEDEWEKVTGHSIFGGDRKEGRTMYISPDEVVEFAKTIEAKLKEKNT